jgi:hypothetical protein
LLRKDVFETWWERVLACVAVALLMMFVIDILLRGWGARRPIEQTRLTNRIARE